MLLAFLLTSSYFLNPRLTGVPGLGSQEPLSPSLPKGLLFLGPDQAFLVPIVTPGPVACSCGTGCSPPHAAFPISHPHGFIP